MLNEALDNIDTKYPALRKIAQRCADPDSKKRYQDVQDLHLALEHRSSNQLYILLIAFMAAMIVILAWLNIRRPKPDGYTTPQQNVEQVMPANTSSDK